VYRLPRAMQWGRDRDLFRKRTGVIVAKFGPNCNCLSALADALRLPPAAFAATPIACAPRPNNHAGSPFFMNVNSFGIWGFKSPKSVRVNRFRSIQNKPK
jgi:hypothetical protein